MNEQVLMFSIVARQTRSTLADPAGHVLITAATMRGEAGRQIAVALSPARSPLTLSHYRPAKPISSDLMCF